MIIFKNDREVRLMYKSLVMEYNIFLNDYGYLDDEDQVELGEDMDSLLRIIRDMEKTYPWLEEEYRDDSPRRDTEEDSEEDSI